MLGGAGFRRRAVLVAANLLAAAAFAWPFVLPELAGPASAHELDGPWIFVALLGCIGLLLFLELGHGGVGPKTVALIGVLGAAMVALRLPGFIGGFSGMFIVVLLAGNAFGPRFGFLLGAVGTFASALFVGGFGPWVPFQMAAVGWVGMGAGAIPGASSGWARRISMLAGYGIVSGYLFGAVMNLWFWPFAAGSSSVGWVPELGAVANVARFVKFYSLTSFAWDTFRAVGNAVAVIALGRALLPALDRAALRMDVKVDFARVG